MTGVKGFRVYAVSASLEFRVDEGLLDLSNQNNGRLQAALLVRVCAVVKDAQPARNNRDEPPEAEENTPNLEAFIHNGTQGHRAWAAQSFVGHIRYPTTENASPRPRP